MLTWVGWGFVALVVGAVLGLARALVRRRPVPEVTSYLPPRSSQGREAVGPHRRLLRASPAD